MALTPLRYPRFLDDGANASYGYQMYITHCERFSVKTNYHDRWVIIPTNHSWEAWMNDNGLTDVEFATRRDALATLATVLQADGMMEADEPS